MITRLTTLSLRLVAGLALSLFVVACGGGGGGGGGGGFLPEEPDTWVLSLTLLDANGNPTDTVTSTNPATLSARVTRNSASGSPVSGEVVTVTTSLGLLDPDTGSALTNEDGEARLRLLGDGTRGAGTLTASVEGPAGTVTQSLNFQTVRANLRLGSFRDGNFVPGRIAASSTSLPRNGTAELIVFVVDEEGSPVETEEEVRFSSQCERSGQAQLPVTATTTNGRVTVDYVAAGCSGNDTVTATLPGTDRSATVDLFVAPPEVTSIVFRSAEPEVLALAGTGGGTGLQETGTVTFEVIDTQNEPIEGIDVRFGLTTRVGGLRLRTTSARSDGDGLVRAVVQSGDVATAVRVTATIEVEAPDGDQLTLTTVSDVLTVTTGLPTQNAISLSAEALKVQGAREFDGVTTQVTVRMADKFNNPVPDGTAATFRTEYGSIEGSCTTTNGACSVTWTSQAPRFPMFNDNRDLVRTTRGGNGYSCPSHSVGSGPCPDDLGYIRGLRSTVLVTAIGEESFTDSNGNGRYDEGEPFVNLPEAFLDHNEDDRYNPAQGCVGNNARCEAAGSEETFVDFNSDGRFSRNVSPEQPDGVFNGVLCPLEGDGIWCSRDLVNVRDSLVLILASESGFDILLVDDSTRRRPSVIQAGRSYTVYVADIYNNAPAAGSSVSISGENGCEIEGGNVDAEVPETNAYGAFTAPSFSLVENAGGSITVTVSGGGVESSATYSCQAAPPEPDEEEG